MGIAEELELTQNNLSDCARNLPLYNYADILEKEGIDIVG